MLKRRGLTFSILLLIASIVALGFYRSSGIGARSAGILKNEGDTLQTLIQRYEGINHSMDSCLNLMVLMKKRLELVEQKLMELRRELSQDSAFYIKLQNTVTEEFSEEQSRAAADSLTQLTMRRISVLTAVLNSMGYGQLEKQMAALKAKRLIVLYALQKQILTIEEGESVNFKGVTIRFFVTHLDSHFIQLHLLRPKHKSSLAHVKAMLESKNMLPLMITNAGMFTPSYEPQGLYIESDPTKRYPLDITTPKTLVNFYLQPNGVFYLDDKGLPHIDTTAEYLRLQKSKRANVVLATQSGPMLVINGRLHPAFIKGSNNAKIRSGVGIINSRKVVFAATLSGSNFYDFALFMRDVLQCKNALFLDGAISKMYLKDIDSTVLGGEFGPIISVSAKRKK